MPVRRPWAHARTLVGATALAVAGSTLLASGSPAALRAAAASTTATVHAQHAPAAVQTQDAGVRERHAGVGARHASASTRGAAGAGDPYFPRYGNGGYQVRHYDVDVTFNPASERLHGRTVIRARARQDLTRFNLDLVLPASSVRVNGRRAAHRRTPHELIVRPARTLHRGDAMTVVVRYAGVPKNHRVGGVRPWVTTKDGAAAVGEPEIAAWWFPGNDHPSDKATFDITLRVPRGLEALSNGRLLGRHDAGGHTVWRWRERRPMATYLAFAVIGRYDLVRGHTASGRPYLYAYSTHLQRPRAARRSVSRTGHITAWLERTWGSYPFGQIGGVVLGKWIGFALENQTRPVYSRAFFEFGVNRQVVAHEMAHQWFGDRVAVSRWRDIWLNEGLATYSEWLYRHHTRGTSVGATFARTYRSEPRTSPFWDVPIGNPGRNRLFSDPVYRRGAMTAHALRQRIGSRAFFRLMRGWVHDNDGNGGSREFIARAERVSGRQLDGFFDAWLYTKARPRPTVANGFPRNF